MGKPTGFMEVKREVPQRRAVAERLDRVAFDPTFADDDGVYDETRKLIGTLAGRHR